MSNKPYKLINETGSDRVLIGLANIKNGGFVRITLEQAHRFVRDRAFLKLGWSVEATTEDMAKLTRKAPKPVKPIEKEKVADEVAPKKKVSNKKKSGKKKSGKKKASKKKAANEGDK